MRGNRGTAVLEPPDETVPIPPDERGAQGAREEDEFWSMEQAPDADTYVYRLADERTPASDPSVGYCTRLIGEITPERVQQVCGGGLFRLLIKRGGLIVKRVNLRIAGPPILTHRELESSGPKAAPAPSAPAAEPPGAVVAAIADLKAELVQLRTAPSAKTTDPFEIVERVLKLTHHAPEPASASELVKAQLEMFRQGMEVRRDSEGGRTIGDAIVEVLPAALSTASQAIEKITALRTSPPATAPAMDGSPAPESTGGGLNVAEVTLAGMVARGLANETDPETFAKMLVNLLSESEVTLLGSVGVTGATLAPRLATYSRSLPDLADELRLTAFLEQTLVELRKVLATLADEQP